jgi:hypothetical protein
VRTSEILTQPLRDAPRWLFLLTLIYAPWAFGCTTAVTIAVLDWLLAAVILLWVADVAYRRSWPSVPFPLLVITALILVVGWAMTLNAHSIYDPEYGVFAPCRSPWPNGPGTFDASLSLALMTRVTFLLLTLVFVADLSRRPVWLLRIWYTIGIAGGSIAFFGLLQKGMGAQTIFWQPRSVPGIYNTFFATYFYHGNAGAFLNLVLPLTLGLALRATSGRTKPAARALWLTEGILVLVAMMANTSRVAQLLGLMLLVAVSVGPARRVLRSSDNAEKWQVGIGIVIALAVLAAIAQASQLHQPLQRWQEFAGQFPNDARWTTARVAISALPVAGWFGFGPGAFRAVFPHYVDLPESGLAGTWRFLHEDYLQTLLEWGVLGSGLLALLFFGAIWIGFRAYRRGGARWLPRQRALIPLVLLGLGSVALHALVDFPLQIASIQLYVATYLGICWSTTRWKAEEKAKTLKS